MHRLAGLDIAVLLTCLAGIVAVGTGVVGRSRSADAFMAAGRSLPGWAVGLSIFGSYISSISFLANPGKSYAGDWNPFVFSLATPIAAWLAVRYFVPFYRRSGEVSAYHHLERRFGPWARTYAVACFLLTQMARMGTIVYLLGRALAPLTGFNVAVIIVLAGTVMTAYTLLGGIEAVVWTGVVQSAVLLLGLAACAVTLVAAVPGGLPQIVTVGIDEGKFGLGSFGGTLSEPTVWVVFAYGLTTHLQNFGIDQSYVQRYVTARTDGDAARSVWIGGLLYVPVAAAFFFIGTALYVLYRVRPELLPAPPAALEPDGAFPHFIATSLPPGITGLVIAALLAAAMDSNLNNMATLTLCDIYRRYFRPHTGDREALWVLRLAMVGWGALGTAAALAMMRVKLALDAWWELASIFSGGVLGLFLLGMVSRRASSKAALGAVAGGVVLILWMTLSPLWTGPFESLRSPFHSLLIIVAGTLTILVVGLAAGRSGAGSERQ